MTPEQKEKRLMDLHQEIFGCEDCGEILGDNIDCDTCIASWPELTDADKSHLKCMTDAKFIENLLAESESELC